MSTTARVIILLDTEQFAGTERHVLQLAAGLARAGASVRLLCRAGGVLEQAARRGGIDTVGVAAGAGILGWLRATVRCARESRPCLLHGHNGRTMLIAAFASRLTGVPAVGTQHFLDPQFVHYAPAKRLVARWAHRRVNGALRRIICVSGAAADCMRQREHVPPAKVAVVWNGIDAPARPPTDRLELLRKEFGATPGQPVVTCVARLEAEKGVAVLIEAVAEAAGPVPGLLVVIVGEGSQRAALEDQVQRSGLGRHVRFTGFRRDATDLVACGDLLVLPSPAEPFGLVLLEAMALGKPVIACRSGGPAEIVCNGRSGFLVGPGDSGAMAQRLGELAVNPVLRSEMGNAAAQLFEQDFRTDRMVDKTLAVYEAAAGMPVRGRAAHLPRDVPATALAPDEA